MRTLCLISVVVFAMLAAAGAALAADAQGGPLVTVQASDMSIKDLAATLTRSGQVPVVVTSDVTGTFNGSFNQKPVEEVLGYVAKASEVKWQKVFVPSATKDADLLTKAREQAAIAAQAQAADTVFVYDPATKTQQVFVKKETDPAQAEASAKELGLKPVYLITALNAKPAPVVTAASSASAEGYAGLARKQEEEFLAMTPDERVQALERSMLDDLAANPTQRAEMAKARMDAYRTLMQGNSATVQQWRDQRRQTFHDLRDQGLVPGRGGRNRGQQQQGQSAPGGKKSHGGAKGLPGDLPF